MRRTTRSPRGQGHRLGDEQTAAAKVAFLEAFERTGIILDGARSAGVSRDTVRVWREVDQDFQAAFAALLEAANDVIRKEIYRRGVTGWVERQVTVNETEVGGVAVIETKTVRVRKYSDTMLRLIAQSRMPEFRDALDVSSRTLVIGASEAIARIADDPDAIEAANKLLIAASATR